MSLQLLDVEYEDSIDKNLPTIIFQFGEGQFSIDLEFDGCDNIEEWTDFRNVMETNGKGSMVFGNCDGVIRIDTTGGTTTFQVAKNFQRNSGHMIVKLPNEKCLEAFKQLVVELKKN